LLFSHPVRLALLRSLEFLTVIVCLAACGIWWAQGAHGFSTAALAFGVLVYGRFLVRVLRAHFPPLANLLSFFGLPLFAGLLVRSWLHSRAGGAVTWKGRTYQHSVTEVPGDSSISGRSRLES